MRPGPKRTKIELAKDRRAIAAAYLRGVFQVDIAAQLNAREGVAYTITQQTISKDLKAIRKEWLASSVRDFDELRANQLAKIDNLEMEHWKAWQRSCENAVTRKVYGKVVKTANGKDSFTQERPAEITTKGQTGDPRFLHGVYLCINRRCALFGLDAPARLEHSGKGEVVLRVVYDDDTPKRNEDELINEQ